jgi:hypothetical protein
LLLAEGKKEWKAGIKERKTEDNGGAKRIERKRREIIGN